MDSWLQWLLGSVITAAFAVVGFFVHLLFRGIEKCEEATKEVGRNCARELEAHKQETINKRHDFRSEMHAYVGEVELRLTRDVQRIERKVDRE